ncbi:TRAP transporter large permease [Variovorax saccharolyticus]|uniref:TRAP transporter large permease n=1 Tax=Variovorax saccharolyticus TaxID=3053516 RepID=UPI0025750412|nr:TRAP transporter large permease subunit [Variovorax sp. J22R187]MDM0022271.1 TRAP transporter large permease subunit [Variovorax sp. J22R187]
MQVQSIALAGGRTSRAGNVLETTVRWITEWPAALLVVVEVGLLLANVTYRYVLHDPLTWGDELASMLFIWLAMLGSVIALQRGQHMRLTTMLEKLTPALRRPAEAFGDALVVVFMLLLIHPAWEYVSEEWAITTPALEIPNGVRVAALAVGFTLMLAIALSRLVMRARLRDVVVSAVAIGALAGLLLAFKPMLTGAGHANLFLFFVVGVSGMVVIGVPIMTAFGLSTMGFLAFSTDLPSMVVVGRIDEGMSGLILLSVPLFVFLGALIEATGMAAAMIRVLASLIGHVRGGLSYVLIGAMYLVSGISGSKAADMAAVAPALFPDMKQRGEDEGELVAMLSASGAMSETIPPSLVLITIGSVTGISIAALFTGGFMPAVVGAIAMAIVVWLKNRNRAAAAEGARASRREVARAFVYALPAMALPFLIRAAVVEGIATATEVATLGVVYTFVVGLAVYRQFDWKRLWPMLIDTASLSGAILIIIGCATSMAWALTQSGFSRDLAAAMASLPGGALGFMLVSVVAFVVLGSLLEGIPAIVLFGPLLFPIARAAGIHEVHYAMVAVFAMGLGLFAPPFGVGFYAACAIGKVSPMAAMSRVWPYLGALFIALLVIAAVPWISIGAL